jgi:hypothetical protein
MARFDQFVVPEIAIRPLIQAEIALKSEGFTDIDFPTLEMILARETLNCKEIVVFEVADGTHSREPGKVVFLNNLKTAGLLPLNLNEFCSVSDPNPVLRYHENIS